MQRDDIIREVTCLFIKGFREEHGCFPSESDKKILAEEIVSVVHGIEKALIDRYGLDEEEKELDPDEYMNRKTNLSSLYGSAITEDIYFED